MIALRFIQLPMPLEFVRRHDAMGSRDVHLFKAALPLHAQELRMIVAKEAAGPSGELLRHISLSVGLAGHPEAVRAPTDEECDAAKQLFSLITFEEIPSDNDPHVRHFWEVLG